MNKICGCSYMGGCLCGPAELTSSEKMDKAIRDMERSLVELKDHTEVAILKKKVESLKRELESANFMKDFNRKQVTVLESKAEKYERAIAKPYKKEIKVLKNVIDLLDPKIAKVRMEVNDDELLEVVKKYMKQKRAGALNN